jgi:HK97 family phage prohead protease
MARRNPTIAPRTKTTELETRTQYQDDAIDLELRVEGDGRKLVGYAARYNVTSNDLGGFRERILPGAFKDALSNGADIRSLIDHDNGKLLGRTSSGTLKLSEDSKGLRFEVDVPETSYGNDLLVSVRRGDVKANSFGFLTPVGGDRFKQEGRAYVRELLNVDLREISVVLSTPAYPGTSVQIRVDPGVIASVNAATFEDNKIEMAKRWLAVHSI